MLTRISVLVVLGGLWAGQSAGWSQSLPMSISLDQAKDIEGWGEAGKDGDSGYRIAQASRAAVVRLPNWWGGTVRPPKGERYIIEVTYKDTASAPTIAECFSGIGPSLSRSELHRFGGSADGQWKVAHVPVSWDLLMLPKGSAAAELAFRAPADLPIATLTIRKAVLPEDQMRWEAESRAWVARGQAAKAAGATQANPDQTPVIPEAWKDKPFVPYVRPYYDNVYPNSAPQKGEAGAAIPVRMARNEFEPAPFAVYAQQDLPAVEYAVSELTGPGGKLQCEIRRYTAEYALEQKGKGLAWVPQRLWPAFPAQVKKGQSGWFYPVLRTLGEASRPGKYQGTVTVTAAGQAVRIPLHVEVLPITLLDMEQAGLRMGGCHTGLCSAGEMATWREHNHNMGNIWFASVRPLMKKAGDRLELDFYYLDDWMRLAKENGVNTVVWFLGGNPNGYPRTLTVERDLYALMCGSVEEFVAKVGSAEGRGKVRPEVREYYKQFLRETVARGREKGWPELIFTPFDEPAKWCYPEPRTDKSYKNAIGCGPWIRDHFKDACALIHEAVPGTKVYISMHRNYVRKVHGYNGRVGEIFIPDCDVICTNAIEEDHELGDKVRKAGKMFWQYSGTASRRYGFGFYFGAWDSRGSLCWAYNWGKRFDVTEGSNWLYGWYSPFETILTPAYEEIREAWDDRRYIETARAAAKAAGKDITGLLDQIRTETLANQGTGGRDLVNDFWEEGRSASQMDQWRARLAKAILEITGK